MENDIKISKSKGRQLVLLPLLLLISLPTIVCIFISPALPYISDSLNISKSQSQTLVSISLFGYALSQLILGSLLNKFGRKRTLYLGLSIGFIASLFSILGLFINSYLLIITARFFTGFGTGVSLVAAYTIINDLYSGLKARKVTGYAILSLSLAPGISNILSGFITQYFNWLFVFCFLSLYILLVLIVTGLLPETYNKKSKLSLKDILIGYWDAVKNKKVIFYSLCTGLIITPIYTIASLLPFIGINEFHLSPSAFGIAYFISYFGYTLGSLSANMVSEKISAEKSVYLGFGIIVIACSVFLFFNVLELTNSINVFIFTFFIFYGIPFGLINTTVLGISGHSDRASASSIINFSGQIITFTSALICSFISYPASYVLPSSLLIFSLTGLCFLSIVARAKKIK
jgi:predicted MFS family arabinose efflux permease